MSLCSQHPHDRPLSLHVHVCTYICLSICYLSIYTSIYTCISLIYVPTYQHTVHTYLLTYNTCSCSFSLSPPLLVQALLQCASEPQRDLHCCAPWPTAGSKPPTSTDYKGGFRVQGLGFRALWRLSDLGFKLQGRGELCNPLTRTSEAPNTQTVQGFGFWWPFGFSYALSPKP